jgi:hypothetical protein
MRAIANLLVLAIVVAGAAFLSAPMFAFYALRAAAQSQDVQALSELVDYPAVRSSLRPQLSDRPEATAPPPSFLEDPIGAVRRQLEQQNPAVRGPDVNAYLTPDAILGLTLGEGRYASQVMAPSANESPAESSAPAPRPRHWGMNRARVAIIDAGGSETLFTWERRGPIQWKLVHIRLPEGATPVAQAPV